MTRPGALPPGTRIADLELERCIAATPVGFEYAARGAGSGLGCRLLEYMPEALAERRGSQVAVRPGASAAFDAGHRAFQRDADRFSLPRHDSLLVTRRLLIEHGTVYTQLPAEDGPTIAAQFGRRGPPLAPDELHAWLYALAGALGRLHRTGMVHGGVSPERIVRRADGRLVLGLPGSAQWALAPWWPELIDADDPTIAPEQWLAPREREAAVGPWTDVYALAALAHRAIAGHMPPPSRRREETLARPALTSFAAAPWSPAMLLAIDRALSPDASARPRDMDDFLSAMGLQERRLRPRAPGESLLTHVLDPAPPAAPPPTPLARVQQPDAQRGVRLWPLLVALLFVLLAAVAIWGAARGPAQRSTVGDQRPSEIPVSIAVRNSG